MPTKTWKTVERKVAGFFPGAQRRGADFRQKFRSGGKNDLIVNRFSVEIKHRKTVSWSMILAAIEQAVEAKENQDDIPVAVIHQEGQEYKDSVVFLRLEDFGKLIQDLNYKDANEIPQDSQS